MTLLTDSMCEIATRSAISGAMVAEATLTYLRIGAQSPKASSGALPADGFPPFRGDLHPVLFAWMVVAVALQSLAFLGDGVRGGLDPKPNGKRHLDRSGPSGRGR